MSSPFSIIAHKTRTRDYTVTIKTASGGYVQLQSSDVVRFKVGRGTAAPSLDLDNVAATANGSVVTVDQLGDGSATHASVTVRLAQGDLASLSGLYDAEVLVVDDSETSPADAIKLAMQGALAVLETQAGDVGKT